MGISFSKIKSWASYVPVVVLFFVLPFVWNTQLLDASLLSRQLVLSFFLIAMLAAFVVMFFRKWRFMFGGKWDRIVFGGLLLFMLMHIVSSLSGVANGYEAFFRTIKEFGFSLFFFFVYQLIISDYRGKELLVKIMLLSGAIFILLGAKQLLNADFSEFDDATENMSYYLNIVMEGIYSTCSNKNLFSSILFLILPIAVYSTFSHNSSRRIASIVWQIFAGIVAVADFSFIVVLLTRTVWAATFFAFVVAYVLVYYWRMHIKPKRTGVKVALKAKLIYIGVPFVLVAFMFVVFISSDTQLERTIVERVALTFNPEKYGYRDNEHGESSVAMRKLIFGKTAEMIKDHPVLGVGPGQWQIEIPKYGVDEFDAKLREGARTFQRPHNDYLWFASETGLLGLLGYLMFFVGIICAGLSNIRQSADNKVVMFNIISVAALSGWIVVSLLDFPHERVEHNLFYLAIMAMMLADSRLCNTADNIEKQSEKPALTVVLLAFGLVVSGLHLWQTLIYIDGEKNSRNILNAYYNEEWDNVIMLTRKADMRMYTLDNITVPVHYYKGIAMSRKDNDEAAIREFKKALGKHPNHLLTYCAMGTSYMKVEDYGEATKCFERVLEMSPRNNQALYDMAVIFYNQKNFKQALDYILRLPEKLEFEPQGFENARRSICRSAVSEDAALYNKEKYIEWMDDDKRVDASIKRFYSDSCAFSQILLKDLGTSN
jgi:O-antigen ligase